MAKVNPPKDSTCERHDEDIDKIQEWINGNGVPGAKSRIRRLEYQMSLILWGVAIVVGGSITWLLGLVLKMIEKSVAK